VVTTLLKTYKLKSTYTCGILYCRTNRRLTPNRRRPSVAIRSLDLDQFHPTDRDVIDLFQLVENTSLRSRRKKVRDNTWFHLVEIRVFVIKREIEQPDAQATSLSMPQCHHMNRLNNMTV